MTGRQVGVFIHIPGQPVAQGRPRFYNGRAVDPPKSREYKERVVVEAQRAYRSEPVAGPVGMRIKIKMPIPSSWAKKKKAMAIAGEIRPISRPDLSNIIKGIEDALNGIVYHDDSQIVELYATSIYVDRQESGVDVTVGWDDVSAVIAFPGPGM